MLGAGELLLISFLFLTSLNCLVTYICSSSCIKLASKKNDYLGAIKKLRKFDNYLLSTLLLVTAVIYVALMYFYFVSILEVSDYFIAFATIGGFIATLFTTFFSRLCYCYACNFILKTKLDEYECFVENMFSLGRLFYPIFIVAFAVPTIYILPFSMQIREILIGVFLAVFVLIYVASTTPFSILSLGAIRLKKGKIVDMVSKLFKEHGIKRYRIYYWDSSRSNDSNAMVTGFFKVNFFISSSLVASIDEKELEAVILHEIAHVKYKHVRSTIVHQTIYLLAIVGVLYYAIISDYTSINLVLIIILAFLLLMAISLKVTKKQEDEADLYVAKHGLGDALISALKKISFDDNEEDLVHGTIDQRKANINKK